jgi:hypothetical protein
VSQIIQEVTHTGTYTKIISTTCELCGTRVSGDVWPAKSGNNVMKTEIGMCQGWNYGGDGGSTTTIIYDICPLCFVNKLEVWLKEQGAKPRIVESEW